MKKSCLAVLIGLFLFAGSSISAQALGLPPTGGNGGKKSAVKTSKEAKSTKVVIRSLPGALQGVLSAKIGANDPEYRMTRSGGVYRAVNARNRLTATIGLDGFTVRAGSNEWGMRLTAWGSGRFLNKIESGTAVLRSNRVAIERGGIVEWWVNGPLGIEQGWTVANRPHEEGNPGRLTLVLRQSGDLRTQALPRGSSLAVSSDSGREVLRYTGLTAYDKTGRQLPAHFEARGKEVRVVVDDTNAAYPVRIDPWVQAARLTASDGVANDDFGYSVALSYDGATLVVGANRASGGSDKGAVYVFQEPPSGWANATEVARLTASDGAAGDKLGSSVAVNWNGTTVVAGAAGADGGKGAVYVFEEPASGWANATRTAGLTASDGAAGDNLGCSVGVSLDGATVFAGASGANSGQGAAYVFQEEASGWADGTQTAELTASDGAGSDELGASVAVNSDGSTVAIGAPGATVEGNSAQGAVYVFEEPASGWADGTQTAELTSFRGAAQDELGYSVAMTSDGSIIVAGAPGATVGGNSAQGAVYLFQMNGSSWAVETDGTRFGASDGAAGDELGYSVAVSSDGTTLAAGALNATVGSNTAQGAVYVVAETQFGWPPGGPLTDKLTGANGDINDHMGCSVSMDSDGTTIVGGAYGATVESNKSQGAAYVFQGPLWLHSEAGVVLGGNESYRWFGNFNVNSLPWIKHQSLGWLYPYGTSTGSIWFYDPQWDGTGGWWWTSSYIFPWVYSNTEGEWFYYLTTYGLRWFCDSSGCSQH